MALPQSPSGKPQPAATPEPAGRGGRGCGVGQEDQGGRSEEVVPEQAERPAPSGAAPSPNHPQRFVQGRRRGGKRGGSSQQPSPNTTAVQFVWMNSPKRTLGPARWPLLAVISDLLMPKLNEYNRNNRAEPVSSPRIFLLIAVITHTQVCNRHDDIRLVTASSNSVN